VVANPGNIVLILWKEFARISNSYLIQKTGKIFSGASFKKATEG